MITFTHISYKNFFSIGNYPISINLTENTNTLIMGTNGVGKSTFVSAICFALYGKPYKEVLKGSIVNSINKKDLLVEIKFKIGSDEYKVRRGMKPNIFEIYMNEKLLNIDGIGGDYQSHLEKNILKMSFHTFKQIVVIGNSGFTPFLKLPAGQRREMIENILDLVVFTKMNTLLKEELSNFKKEKDEKDKQSFQTKVRISGEEDKLKFLQEKKNDEYENQKTELLNQIQRKQELLERIPTEYPDFDAQKKELDSNLRKIEIKEATINSELNFIQKEIKLLECATCPTCKQEIGNDFKLQRLSDIEIEKTTKNETIEKIDKAKKVIILRTNEILEKITKRDQLVRSAEKLKIEINSINEEINRLRPEENNIDIKTIEIEKDRLSTELIELEAEIIQFNKEIELRNLALTILKDNGVKAKIIRTYIPLINQFINEYLELMNFYVLFEIDENFNETIKSRHRDIFTYENFSDGEKARIDLAFLFTWRKISKLRNGISTNLLILDEVFSGSLDASGIDDLNMILRNLENSNVFVITHRLEGVIEKFDSIIEFKKDKNFTIMSRNENDI